MKVMHDSSVESVCRAFRIIYGMDLLLFCARSGQRLGSDDLLGRAAGAHPGLGTCLALHDGMTGLEAVVLFRVVLGIRADLIRIRRKQVVA
jgi:hypothetical protein